MMMLRIFFLFFSFCAFSSHARDFTIPVFSDFAYINDSDYIVKVELIRKIDVGEKACIYDYYSVKVVESLKGDIPASTVLTIGLSNKIVSAEKGSSKLLFLNDASSEFRERCVTNTHKKMIADIASLKLENTLKWGLFNIETNCDKSEIATFTANKCGNKTPFIFKFAEIFQFNEYVEDGYTCQSISGRWDVLMESLQDALKVSKDEWIKDNPYDAL